MGERTILEIARRLDAGASRRATCATCAASPTCSAGTRRCRSTASTTRPATDAPSSCPPSRRSRGDKRAFADATRVAPPRDEPPQRAAPHPAPRRPHCSCVNPPAPAARRGGDGRASTTCPTRAGRTRATREADPRLRDDQRLGADHARLLRRLHVLLDHACTRAAPSRAAAERRSSREVERDGAPTRTSRARSATSAGRRRTCTRCAARGPRSRRSAGASRACTRRSASCSAPTTGRRSS